MLPVKEERRWGIIDAQGKMVATPQFDAVSEISARQAVVVRDGKYGLLDSAGQTLIDTRYTYLRRHSDQLAFINQGGDCQGLDCDGGKWGLINLPLNRTLEPVYSLIQKFDRYGLAFANVGGKCGYESCEGGRWGVVDTAASQVLPPIYLKVTLIDRNEAYIQSETGWGIFDMSQQRVKIQPKYEELKRFARNRIAMRSGKLWGVLNDRGDTLVPPRYDGFMDGGKGYLAWMHGEKYGLMDSMGRVLTPARYDFLLMEDYDWLRVKVGAYFGLSDTADHELTRQDLKQITHFGNGFAIINRGGQSGVVNRKGEEIVSVRYDKCELANDSLIFAQNGLVLKWYTTTGKLQKSIAFDSLSVFTKNRVAKGKVNGSWGLINKEGTWVVPPKYEEIKVYFQASKGRRGDNEDFYYFDEKGHTSKVKRIVIIKEEEELELDLLNIQGTNLNVGWFLHSGGLWGLRNPTTGRIVIDPQFKAVEVVPGTSVTCVKDKIKNSENLAWGLIDHTTGRKLTEILFERIEATDFLSNDYARVQYFGSGKYALLSIKGQSISFDNAAYIGPVRDGMARVNLGGQLVWTADANIDTISSLTSIDRNSNEVKTTYRYCTGGKWGYIDPSGKWLKPAEYECALDFQGDLARVRIKGKWGAVSRNFQIVVEPRYDFIEQMLQVDGRTLFAIGQDRVAFGFIDERGEIAIKPSFEEVGEYHNGYVRIRQEGLWGYANRQGEVVIQARYMDAGDFHEGCARVRNARSWGYIDTLGNNVTPQKYLRAGDFREGLAWVQGEKFFGFVDLEGKIAITPAFSAVGDFSEGLAPAKRKGAYGLIDRKGNWVVQPSYYHVGKFQDSLAVIQEMGNFGLITPMGAFVVKPMYKEIADFQEGLARFRNGMEYGYLDHNGNTAIASEYSNAGDFSCGRAAIFVQGKWGFIDTSGSAIVPAQYAKVNDFYEDRAAVRADDMWGFIDPQGRVAVPMTYDRVGDFQDGRAPVKTNRNGWGFINADGTMVIPCKHAEIGFRKNGIISVCNGGKWGLINSYGAQLTPCKYDVIGNYREGLASVMLRRSIGVVDGKGKILLDPHYDTITRIGDLLQVEDEDAMGYIDLEGKWVWNPTK